ncbi:acyltransferase domain-containing protein [Clostridium sp. BNL1100]|uniref:acyltransferase domain-containing protein n=1 Tax=Clostridium sp. BNL1100 TaxID=755731 RepID=UPI00024A793B|nr:acyltransferase domain-containing protein [Clostridium sp. BNL1100]AEY66112.1 acyltransferase family protein [Clostridium sp. BNL1100]
MKKPIVFMFSGQGSQYYNMGKELFLNNPLFKEWMLKLDKIYYNLCGSSVIDQIYYSNNIKEQFYNILYTHPAIFMVEYSLAQVLLHNGIYPEYVLGASLGEFAACAVSGVVDFPEAMECIYQQAQIIKENCCEGRMLAVLNNYLSFYDISVLHDNSELASVNFQSHFVVSGGIESISKIQKYLKENKCAHQLLPVKYAFHSSLIESAASDYRLFIKNKIFKNPQVNYISCICNKNNSPCDMEFLWDVVRYPMDIRNAVLNIMNKEELIYIDIGPMGTLGNFIKYNIGTKYKSQIFKIITPYSDDNKQLEDKTLKVLKDRDV